MNKCISSKFASIDFDINVMPTFILQFTSRDDGAKHQYVVIASYLIIFIFAE